ncbi:hypothetical protein [Streptomyces koyangensis]
MSCANCPCASGRSCAPARCRPGPRSALFAERGYKATTLDHVAATELTGPLLGALRAAPRTMLDAMSLG